MSVDYKSHKGANTILHESTIYIYIYMLMPTATAFQAKRSSL